MQPAEGSAFRPACADAAQPAVAGSAAAPPAAESATRPARFRTRLRQPACALPDSGAQPRPLHRPSAGGPSGDACASPGSGAEPRRASRRPGRAPQPVGSRCSATPPGAITAGTLQTLTEAMAARDSRAAPESSAARWRSAVLRVIAGLQPAGQRKPSHGSAPPPAVPCRMVRAGTPPESPVGQPRPFSGCLARRGRKLQTQPP